jgi:hypothetical protein
VVQYSEYGVDNGNIALQTPKASVNSMTAAPVIKATAVFEPEPLSSNPFLNIEVVS